jgi:hypothetical protein
VSSAFGDYDARELAAQGSGPTVNRSLRPATTVVVSGGLGRAEPRQLDEEILRENVEQPPAAPSQG